MTDTVKKKVLMVDDDPMIIALMTKTLEGMGFEVFKSNNGQEALTTLKQVKPDLIIMDQMMPIMDGIKACALIKADRRFKDIPVIMFTASADEEQKKLSQQVGANAYCNKPLNIAILSQKIQELVK
jgi:CheY-like chemotaxis protein